MVKVCQEGQMWGLIVVAAGRIAVKNGLCDCVSGYFAVVKGFFVSNKKIKKYVM